MHFFQYGRDSRKRIGHVPRWLTWDVKHVQVEILSICETQSFLLAQKKKRLKDWFKNQKSSPRRKGVRSGLAHARAVMNSLKVLASNFQYRRGERIRNFIENYLYHPWVVYSFDSCYNRIFVSRKFDTFVRIPNGLILTKKSIKQKCKFYIKQKEFWW